MKSQPDAFQRRCLSSWHWNWGAFLRTNAFAAPPLKLRVSGYLETGMANISRWVGIRKARNVGLSSPSLNIFEQQQNPCFNRIPLQPFKLWMAEGYSARWFASQVDDLQLVLISANHWPAVCNVSFAIEELIPSEVFYPSGYVGAREGTNLSQGFPGYPWTLDEG